jgi:hypothetical protein
VWLSHTVKDLAAGSGLRFTAQGERSFVDLPGQWELFAVERDKA